MTDVKARIRAIQAKELSLHQQQLNYLIAKHGADKIFDNYKQVMEMLADVPPSKGGWLI